MSDEQAISAVVHLYVDGMAFANEGALRKAFHPDAAIIGNYKGALEWTTRDGFIKTIVEVGAAPLARSRRWTCRRSISPVIPQPCGWSTVSPANATPTIWRW